MSEWERVVYLSLSLTHTIICHLFFFCKCSWIKSMTIWRTTTLSYFQIPGGVVEPKVFFLFLCFFEHVYFSLPAGGREGERGRERIFLSVCLSICPLCWALSLFSSETIDTWLILPVAICSLQRLSHACLSINNFILWNCRRLIKSVIIYLMITFYMDNRTKCRANTCVKSQLSRRDVFIRLKTNAVGRKVCRFCGDS